MSSKPKTELERLLLKLDGQRARRAVLNSHYGINPKPVSDCCGWFGVWPATFEEAVPKVIRDKMLNGDWIRPWTRKIEDILPKRRDNTPQVFYISSANYTDATKFLLEGVAKRFTKRPLLEESFFELADNDEMTEFIKSITNSDGFVCPSMDIQMKFPVENNKVCKLKTEETKMEAKKCERCGKLYEMTDRDDYIAVYMPGTPVSDWAKENYSESRIRKDNTRVVSVNFRGGQIVDLCPECREKLKNFFESGKDDPVDVAVREVNTVIKKAEE